MPLQIFLLLLTLKVYAALTTSVTAARPLSNPLKKYAPFPWSAEQLTALAWLKTLLSFTPILGHFNDSAPTDLCTDSSGYGIGAVLL